MITLSLWKRPTINWLFVMERSKKTIFFFVTKQIRNWFCCGKLGEIFFFRFQNKIWYDRPLAKLDRSLFCHPYVTSQQMLLKSELACRVWWSLTGSGCLRGLWGAKQILVLLESCLLTKAYQRCWNLWKLISLLLFQLSTSTSMCREVYFYLLKKLKTITSDDKHMNIHIFIKSRTIIIYRGVY